MNHTFDKYDSYLSMKPRFSRDSLAVVSSIHNHKTPIDADASLKNLS